MGSNNNGAYSDVNSKGNRGLKISIGSTQTEVRAHATTEYKGRQTVTFENYSNQIIYIGHNGVTANNGHRLYPGQKGGANFGPDNQIYAIVA